VWCWGSNFSGELGAGHPDGSTAPVLVALPQRATAIAAGGFMPEQGNPQATSCALLSDKTAVCWGANGSGQLGNGLVANSAMPVQVKGVSNITELSLGGGQGCAVTGGGKLYCWGRNDMGQVGNAKVVNAPTPISVLNSATHVSCGEQHTCALTSNSDLYCWGSSASGRLGIKPLPQATNVPLIVPGMNDTDEVSAGGNHTCGRRGTQISCWGYDYSGAVNATFSNVETPVNVNINGNPPASKSVVIGNGMSSSIGTDDVVTVWGALFHGDGQGSTGYDPAKLGIGKVLGISLGKGANAQSTICALKADHSVACWGSDTYGQVGNGDPVADTKSPAILKFAD
jgi:alpha-tubulin suppressor-like RCC1 family protein